MILSFLGIVLAPSLRVFLVSLAPLAVGHALYVLKSENTIVVRGALFGDCA